MDEVSYLGSSSMHLSKITLETFVELRKVSVSTSTPQLRITFIPTFAQVPHIGFLVSRLYRAALAAEFEFERSLVCYLAEGSLDPSTGNDTHFVQ